MIFQITFMIEKFGTVVTLNSIFCFLKIFLSFQTGFSWQFQVIWYGMIIYIVQIFKFNLGTKVRNIYLFFSSRSLKTREFTIMSKKRIVNSIIQKLKSKHTSLKKIYQLSKTDIFFSRFEGTRGEKTQIFRTLVPRLSLKIWTMLMIMPNQIT